MKGRSTPCDMRCYRALEPSFVSCYRKRSDWRRNFVFICHGHGQTCRRALGRFCTASRYYMGTNAYPTVSVPLLSLEPYYLGSTTISGSLLSRDHDRRVLVPPSARATDDDSFVPTMLGWDTQNWSRTGRSGSIPGHCCAVAVKQSKTRKLILTGTKSNEV